MSKDILITPNHVSCSNSEFFNRMHVFCSENDNSIEIAQNNKQNLENFEQKIREILEGGNAELTEFSLYYFKTKKVENCAKEHHELENEFALRSPDRLYFCKEHLNYAFRNQDKI